MNIMRAKMIIEAVQEFHFGENGAKSQETLDMRGIGKSDGYAPDGLDENNTFARFTPMAKLTLSITNPELFGKFKRGDALYVDFSRAPG